MGDVKALLGLIDRKISIIYRRKHIDDYCSDEKNG